MNYRARVVFAHCVVIWCSLTLAQEGATQRALEFMASPEGQAFLESYERLKEAYVRDLDDAELLRGALDGMLATLDDPFTFYTPPQAANAAREQRTGSFAGIGIYLSLPDPSGADGVRVAQVIPDSPAEAAGLLAGDVFRRVNGAPVAGLSADEVAALTRGEVDTSVRLELYRPAQDAVLTFDIVRAQLELVSVESFMLPGGTGYLSVATFFHLRVAEQIRAALDELVAEGATSLILDLRDNGGGFIYQATTAADYFLPAGVIFWERDRKGTVPTRATMAEDDVSLPMVILVNGGTASAAEVFVAALAGNRRATIIGENSFGKSVEGELFALSNEGELSFTFREWLTPFLRSINGVGLEPDLYVKDTRFAERLMVSGTGATAGQTVQIMLDGELVGEAVVTTEGVFEVQESVRQAQFLPEQHLPAAYPAQLVSRFQGDAIFITALDFLKR